MPNCTEIFSKINHFKPTVTIHFNELQRGLHIKFLLLKSKFQKKEAFNVLIAVSLKGQVEGRGVPKQRTHFPYHTITQGQPHRKVQYYHGECTT